MFAIKNTLRIFTDTPLHKQYTYNQRQTHDVSGQPMYAC